MPSGKNKEILKDPTMPSGRNKKRKSMACDAPCRYFMEKNLKDSNKQIAQIYDRIFKKILTLSTRAVIGLINGLFGTEYPPDSRITYNWTEHHDDNLRKTLADTIITINQSHSYHIEAQMYEDEGIEFRVFDYGYGHAVKTRNDAFILHFPEPRIIYLYLRVKSFQE